MNQLLHLRLLNLLSKFDSSSSLPSSGAVPTWNNLTATYDPVVPSSSGMPILTGTNGSSGWHRRSRLGFLPHGKKIVNTSVISGASLNAVNPGFQLIHYPSTQLKKLYVMTSTSGSYNTDIDMYLYSVNPASGLPMNQLDLLPLSGSRNSVSINLGLTAAYGWEFLIPGTVSAGWYWISFKAQSGFNSSASVFQTETTESFREFTGEYFNAGYSGFPHGLEETSGFTLSNYNGMEDNLDFSSIASTRVALMLRR